MGHRQLEAENLHKNKCILSDQRAKYLSVQRSNNQFCCLAAMRSNSSLTVDITLKQDEFNFFSTESGGWDQDLPVEAKGVGINHPWEPSRWGHFENLPQNLLFSHFSQRNWNGVTCHVQLCKICKQVLAELKKIRHAQYKRFIASYIWGTDHGLTTALHPLLLPNQRKWDRQQPAMFFSWRLKFN